MHYLERFKCIMKYIILPGIIDIMRQDNPNNNSKNTITKTNLTLNILKTNEIQLLQKRLIGLHRNERETC